MRKALLSLALAAGFVSAAPALAGFTASTGPDTLTNIDNNANSAADVGDGFQLLKGSFSSYLADGPGDPQLTGGDLPKYGYQMIGTVSSVSGGVVSYTGNYTVFYDLNNDDLFTSGADTSIGAGTFTMTADFSTGLPASLNGTLIQTAGPSGPFASNFSDFGALYNYAPLAFTGTYSPIGDGSTGTVTGSLATTASPVPLPAAGLGGLVLCGLLGLKRSRA